MNTYELMLIFSSGLSTEEQKKIISKIENFITGAKGKLLSCDEWGKKALAYRIKKNLDGFYWLMSMELEPVDAAKLNNNLRLEDQTVRFMFSQTDRKQPVSPQKENKETVKVQEVKQAEPEKKEVKKTTVKSKKTVK